MMRFSLCRKFEFHGGCVMRKSIRLVFVAAVFVSFLSMSSLNAQERKGSIIGHVTDINHDPLVGARVELLPIGVTTTSDAQCQFTYSDPLPSKCTGTVTYAGFKTLSNETLEGGHVPPPESVRQGKVDATPADLVDSVEINKTLSPSQEGDAIGGSVNLVTKRAGERPFASAQTVGGYTPVGLGGRLNEFDGTIGRRFGGEKRLGLLIGGSYDYNQRGTDDIEPSVGVNPIFAGWPGTHQAGTFFVAVI